MPTYEVVLVQDVNFYYTYQIEAQDKTDAVAEAKQDLRNGDSERLVRQSLSAPDDPVSVFNIYLVNVRERFQAE